MYNGMVINLEKKNCNEEIIYKFLKVRVILS